MNTGELYTYDRLHNERSDYRSIILTVFRVHVVKVGLQLIWRQPVSLRKGPKFTSFGLLCSGLISKALFLGENTCLLNLVQLQKLLDCRPEMKRYSGEMK